MAARIAQPTPRDIREAVDGLAARGGLAASARLTAIPGLAAAARLAEFAGLIASRGNIASAGLAASEGFGASGGSDASGGFAGFGANDIGAKITPAKVTAIPIPRNALIRSPLASESATVSAG